MPRYRLERIGARCTLPSRTVAGWCPEGTFDYSPDLWALMAEFVANDERLVMDVGPVEVMEMGREVAHVG